MLKTIYYCVSLLYTIFTAIILVNSVFTRQNPEYLGISTLIVALWDLFNENEFAYIDMALAVVYLLMVWLYYN